MTFGVPSPNAVPAREHEEHNMHPRDAARTREWRAAVGVLSVCVCLHTGCR